jgi:hypothetical protein
VRVGDIGIVPYPDARAQLGCEAEPGLVVEDRRSVLLLWFPSKARSHWVPREQIEAVPLGRLAAHPRVDQLHRIARALDAEWIEVGDDDADDPDVFLVHVPGADLEDLVRVQREFEGDLETFRVEPGTMRRVQLRLRFSA